MYTMSTISKKRTRRNPFFIFLLSLCISLTFLSAAVKVTLNFRPLYYFDVDHLEISQESGYPKEEIIKNYDALIDYMKTSFKGELKFPTFPMSPQAKEHFVEVKNIFTKFDYILIGGPIISIIGILILVRYRSFSFLKWSAVLLIVLPVLLAIPFAINFDASFTAFHKLFFSNDYWLFDPATDPIINVLPQAFFEHCAILILAMITVVSAVFYMLYRKITKKENSRKYY